MSSNSSSSGREYRSVIEKKWSDLRTSGFNLKPWWLNHPIDERELNAKDREIKEHFRAYKQYIESNINNNNADDIKRVLRYFYLFEIWSGECHSSNKINEDTEEFINIFIEECDEHQQQTTTISNKFREYAIKIGIRNEEEDLRRTKLKLLNLKEAIDTYLLNYPPSALLPLSNEFICALHEMVMKNIIDNSGKFRTKEAGPSKSSQLYCTPKKITTRLSILLNFLNQQLQNQENHEFLFRVLLASFFFSEFLLIHPFSNGNGRTARILLSMILSDCTIVPFSICTTNQQRKVYLQCLDERMTNIFDIPNSLATFILLEIYKFSSTIIFSVILD